MPQTLTSELITAAIDGFEEQKKRIDNRLAELRQMLKPHMTAVSATIPTKKRQFSAAARKRMAAAQRKRWAERRAAAK
jgi:hypothetical protein